MKIIPITIRGWGYKVPIKPGTSTDLVGFIQPERRGRGPRGAGAENEEPPTGTTPRLSPQHSGRLPETMGLTSSGGGSRQRSQISGGCDRLGALPHPYIFVL